MVFIAITNQMHTGNYKVTVGVEVTKPKMQ